MVIVEQKSITFCKQSVVALHNNGFTGGGSNTGFSSNLKFGV